MEFLFPYAERKAALDASGGNPDYPRIAHNYGIPLERVELYLSDNYMEQFGVVEKLMALQGD